jgi:hypothetical protein
MRRHHKDPEGTGACRRQTVTAYRTFRINRNEGATGQCPSAARLSLRFVVALQVLDTRIRRTRPNDAAA